MPITRPLLVLSRAFYGLGFFGALSVIAYLSLSTIPFKVPDLGLNMTDKMGHALAYGVTMCLGCLFARECHAQKKLTLRSILIMGLALFGYGIIIEVLQQILPVNRWAQGWDVVANGLGILAAGLLCHFLLRDRTVKKA